LEEVLLTADGAADGGLRLKSMNPLEVRSELVLDPANEELLDNVDDPLLLG
jgi:hypothetical protein